MLELSAYLYEIPNEAHTITLSQNLIGYSTLDQDNCKLINRCRKRMKRQIYRFMRYSAKNTVFIIVLTSKHFKM